jgi:hypothetical protein
MFDTIRSQLERDIAAAISAIAAAQGRVSAATTAQQQAQQRLDTANAALQSALRDAASAQSDVNAAQADVASCQAQLKDAQARHDADDIRLAQAALRDAQSDLFEASEQLGTCNTLVGQTRGEVATAQNALTATQGDASRAKADLVAAETRLTGLQAKPAALDTEESRITDSAPDSTELQEAADAETDAAIVGRRQRHDLRVDRATATGGLAGILSEHDAMLSTIAGWSTQIRGLDGYASVPDFAAIASAIDTYIASAVAQRSKQPLERAADPAVAAAALNPIYARLQAVLVSVTATRDATQQALDPLVSRVRDLKNAWDWT